MASISVTVSETTGLFSISIDWGAWNNFSVIDGAEGLSIQTISLNSITTYTQQQGSHLLEFFLSLDPGSGVKIINQGLIMVLAGKSSNYMCAIVYAGDGSYDSLATLTGVCQEVGQNFTATGSSSIPFPQFGMSGAFSTTA